MPVGRGGIAGAPPAIPAGIILVGIAPFLIYLVTMGTPSAWLTGAVVVAQVTSIVWLLTRSLAVWLRAILGVAILAVVAATVFLLQLPTHSLALAVGGIWHAAAYSGLLVWFARSLRPDREPVVTRFARQMRRTMPVNVVRYTRGVTIAWCVFFAAQLAISAALLAGAPSTTWSSFINHFNPPLIVAMILAEFGCRLLLFRRETRTGLMATLAGLRHIRGAPGNRS
jgi:uncharacterized membrane protein